MALQRIRQGSVVDFVFKVRQPDTETVLDLCDLDLVESEICWIKPDGTIVARTNFLLFTDGTDGKILYKMFDHSPLEFELDTPGTWKVELDLKDELGRVIRTNDPIKFIVEQWKE